MIPAATLPGVSQARCAPDAPCWIAGTGFRAVVDTAQACAIEDAPLAGKVPPGSMMTRLPVDPYAALAGSLPAVVMVATPGTAFAVIDDTGRPALPCCIVQQPAEPLPQPAPVALEASTAAMLVVALGLLAILRRLLR